MSNSFSHIFTESDFLKMWGVSSSFQPLVLIRCNTYNHEKYIEDAIKGFLSQITTFPFKIQIHDDASSDSTQEIIQKYWKEYPHIIIPIFEKTNLYSKHDGSLNKAITNNKEGKYIALCEGDDYWVDCNKLEEQVRFLEKNPDFTMCFSNGFVEDQRKNPIVREDFFKINAFGSLGDSFATNQIIDFNNANIISFPPTASFVFRKSVEEKYNNLVPLCPKGDMRLRMMSLIDGKTFYMCKPTCVYRTNVGVSVTSNWKRLSRSNFNKVFGDVLLMLDAIDEISDHLFSEGIYKIKKPNCEGLLLTSNSFKVLKNKDVKRAYKEMSFGSKIKCIIGIIIPNRIIDFSKMLFHKKH